MSSSNERAIRIEKLIKKKINPTFIEIIDNSHLHANHGNIDEGATETHLHIKILSSHFKGMSKVQMHKKVYEILKIEFKKGLHALELDLKKE